MDLKRSPNIQAPMTNKAPTPKSRRAYDLAERTASFGEDVVRFAGRLGKNAVTVPLIGQVVRSGTSVGANYAEADEAVSLRDFKHKIGICKKEARETMHWLRMIATADSSFRDDCARLWDEAHQFVLIFSAITRKRKEQT